MKIFNTQSKEKEDFEPFEGHRVKMYVCGPTVYNDAHLGHARAAITFDMIRRFLEHEGYHVIFVQNFTDVDDKIINKAAEEGTTITEISRRYALSYLRDMDALNVRRADYHPLATETIPYMLEIIQKLIDAGHAYVGEQGDVFFDTDSFPEYGKLSKRPNQEMESLGARDEGLSEKRNPKDFALWKARPGENEVGWEAPWGRGRPGWHIECSAMNLLYLGESIDIHGGGQDLIFPHHENEIAQCEALTGKQFVKYWIHNGFVTVDNEKMSKSLGNFFLVLDLLKEFTGDEIRLFLLTSSYRKPVNFSLEILRNSTAQNQRIEAALEFLENKLRQGGLNLPDLYDDRFHGDYELPNLEQLSVLMQCRDKFMTAMRDDFNTPHAIAQLLNAAKIINGWADHCGEPDGCDDISILRHAYVILKELLGILGLYVRRGVVAGSALSLLEQFIEAKLHERDQARQDKNYAKADEIRNELNNLGVEVKDASTGSTWSWKKAT